MPRYLLMLRDAEAFDGAAEDLGAVAQLCGGDELARAVRDAYVAGAEDDRVGPQLGQLRRLRAEGDGARRPPRQLFERLDERRVLARLGPAVEARDCDLAVEVRVLSAQAFDLAPHEVGDKLRLLTRHGAPFEREAAPARDDVLRRAAVDEPDVERRVRRVERLVREFLQLFRHRLDSINQPRGAHDGRRAEMWVSAVPLAAAHRHLREAVALARAHGSQAGGLAD